MNKNQSKIEFQPPIPTQKPTVRGPRQTQTQIQTQTGPDKRANITFKSFFQSQYIQVVPLRPAKDLGVEKGKHRWSDLNHIKSLNSSRHAFVHLFLCTVNNNIQFLYIDSLCFVCTLLLIFVKRN